MTDRKVAEVFPPGEFIKEELEARNWSQVDLAEIIGRNPNVINELIMGKRSITPETAKALGDAFGTSAQYWMNLESMYQLWRVKDTDTAIARRAKLYEIAPVKEMVRRQWIEPSQNIEALEKRLLDFFDLKTPDDKIRFPYAARKSSKEYSPAQVAWFFRARQLASAVSARPFSVQSFNAGLTRLRGLLVNARDIRQIPEVLAQAGIRFLILEHLPHTKIDGAAFWLDRGKPVIALSMRYDRIDYFWFTLSHELGHIKRRDGLEAVILDIELVGKEGEPSERMLDSERQANSFATEFLIDQSQLRDFIARVHPLYSARKILDFAAHNKAHPGIVVGQLQFRKELKWESYRRMLEKVKHIITETALTDGWGHTVAA
ncbi:HigA family addiction module antidote protein [Candidatus Poribacteria bacterium]|nr:HigA family addiction module antidote protein [Candidatus Poribacteria bacterium]